MKIKELINLPPGKYVLIDNILNYKYEMRRENANVGLVAVINQLGSISCGDVFIHYSPNNSGEPCVTANVHSAGFHGEVYGFKSELSRIHLVCKYSGSLPKEELKKFRINHIINSYRSQKKFLRTGKY